MSTGANGPGHLSKPSGVGKVNEIPEILRASHPDIGAGLISFAGDGAIIIAAFLCAEDCERLGIHSRLRAPSQILPRLAWPRPHVFEGSGA